MPLVEAGQANQAGIRGQGWRWPPRCTPYAAAPLNPHPDRSWMTIGTHANVGLRVTMKGAKRGRDGRGGQQETPVAGASIKAPAGAFRRQSPAEGKSDRCLCGFWSP
jgi:hypothetical protein